MLRRAACFIVSSAAAYLVLAGVFAAFCALIGHNTDEMLYGGMASFTLALVAGWGLERLWSTRV
jgi:hypothetical protein